MDRLFIEQEQLRACGRILVALVDQPRSADRATVAAARWQLARALMRHLPHKDRLVYARLRYHRDLDVARKAERFSNEAAQLYALFLDHTERWSPAAIEADWATYGVAVRAMAAALDDRISREEAELLPHLATAPETPAARSPSDRNWAADGWRIRAMLGIDVAAEAA